MWEQRYGALKPNRSEGNTRYYDNTQLRRLLNIVSLMSGGYKVSELCSMADAKLFALLEEQLKKTAGKDEESEYFISQLIAAGVTFNETHFEKIFSNCVLRTGMKNTYIRVIYPLLARIGLMWATDKISPAYEHFVSNIIKQKLYTAIDSLPPAKSTSEIWLLFLPENEFHEMGLLFSHYLIRQAGQKVIYLGTNVPLDTLLQTKTEINPAHLLVFFVHHNETDELREYLAVLKNNFRNSKIHISGNSKLLERLKNGNAFDMMHSVADLERQLG